MEFWLQAGSPRITGRFDPDDEDLGEAVETVFPLTTESALLVWHHIYVPLGYKYDFGTIIDDVLHVLDTVLSVQIGSLSVHWPSNTFSAEWHLRWSGETMTIDAMWHSVVGNLEMPLTATGGVSIPTRQFLAEWQRPLYVIATALEHSGYSPVNISGMGHLLELINRLPTCGFLYPMPGNSS